jgi:tetratricopeptide (TPR) repeat protein
MLQRMLIALFSNVGRTWQGRGFHARDKLRRAFDRYAEGNFVEACTLCEAALALEPDLADASCLLGVLACRGGDADSGARAIERAVNLSPHKAWYLAALADARLLQQRAGDAQTLYSQAFPRRAADLAGLTDANLPWKRAHPDWMRNLMRVTLPLSLPDLEGAHKGQLRAEAEAAHLLNWALVLVSQRRVRQAISLLQQAVTREPNLAYGHAVLALLHTLNRDWTPALAAAFVARSLGAEAFPGSNDLCVLSAQLATNTPHAELDPVFDWRPFTAPAEAGSTHLERLPTLEGGPYPRFPENVLVYFIACDPRYFLEYGIALACSIRDTTVRDAIHFHIYNPTPGALVCLEYVALGNRTVDG